MAIAPGPPAPPQADPTTTANYLWSIIDKRIMDSVKTMMDGWGRPRSRTLTINFPIAGNQGAPVPGWLVSVGIAHNIKIVGWAINAIVPGSIVVDVRVSTIQASSGTQPAIISLPGSSNYISHSGYTSFSNDTSAWDTTQVTAGAFMHIYVISASGIEDAVLALRVIDMDSKTISP